MEASRKRMADETSSGRAMKRLCARVDKREAPDLSPDPKRLIRGSLSPRNTGASEGARGESHQALQITAIQELELLWSIIPEELQEVERETRERTLKEVEGDHRAHLLRSFGHQPGAYTFRVPYRQQQSLFDP